MGNANSNYERVVFLNHRGPDTKKTIASLLYVFLTSFGLKVFLDREELEGGLILETQIKEAIASASLHVAIFSPRYAQSPWCLKELHLMTVSGKPIIPIFYGVKPADLRMAREHTGAYAEDLDKHERKIKRDGQPRYNSTTVLNWRNALYRAADFSGFDLETLNGDWGVLLSKVVECVSKRVEKPSFQISYEMRHRSGGILDTVKTIGMHKQLIALGRMLLNYIEWVPRPWRGIEEFNGGIEKITVLSHDMKGLQMIVLKVKVGCDRCEKRVLITICRVEGVDSIAMNRKEMTLTVIGSTDPVFLTASLRKIGVAELISVGPAREISLEDQNRRDRALNSRLSCEPSLLQGKRKRGN